MARKREASAQAKAIKVITGMGERLTKLSRRVDKIERHVGLKRKRAGLDSTAAHSRRSRVTP